MKKRKVLFLGLIIALCFSVGFTTYSVKVGDIAKNNISKNAVESVNKINNSVVQNSTQDVIKNNVQKTTTENITKENIEKASSNVTQEDTGSLPSEIKDADVVSNKDKDIKAEIEKYVDTNIDFKFVKEEKINDKVFKLTFSEVENIVKNDEKIIYKNEISDTFKFDAKSGKLREAIIDSLVTQKTDKSVDKNSSQEIAIKYANTKYETSEYKIYSYKETTKGHNFIYARYIGGYPSSDKFTIKVGYDGNIVYISDFTDIFIGKELNYDKAFIDAKIKENTDESKVDWDSVKICIHDGKVAISYTVLEQCATALIPLE